MNTKYIFIGICAIYTPSPHCGLPVVLAPLLIYSDDTSSNRSKKWNTIDLWCVTLACLPKYEPQKFENIHFISCSNQLSTIEMSKPIVNDLISLERGIILMYDALSKSDILVIAPVICAACDNVRAAELVNHLGSKATKLCWICMVSNFSCIPPCMMYLD